MPDDKALLDSDLMYRKLMEAGETWADTKAAYQALDNATASVLADLTQGYRDGKDGPSRAEAETMARRAQVRYDSLKTLIELRRSEESSRRAEMRL